MSIGSTDATLPNGDVACTSALSQALVFLHRADITLHATPFLCPMEIITRIDADLYEVRSRLDRSWHFVLRTTRREFKTGGWIILPVLNDGIYAGNDQAGFAREWPILVEAPGPDGGAATLADHDRTAKAYNKAEHEVNEAVKGVREALVSSWSEECDIPSLIELIVETSRSNTAHYARLSWCEMSATTTDLESPVTAALLSLKPQSQMELLTRFEEYSSVNGAHAAGHSRLCRFLSRHPETVVSGEDRLRRIEERFAAEQNWTAVEYLRRLRDAVNKVSP
jgi:hypothetical protein